MDKINEMLNQLKKDNPNANMKNLTTAIVVIILVIIFSTWYFKQSPEALNSITDTINKVVAPKSDKSDIKETEGTKTVVVKEGEGLWQIAERECGDGQLYVKIAEENGFLPESALEVGQSLKVSCNAGIAK